MIRIIAGREIRQNIDSFKFAIISLIMTVLVATSIFVMYRDYTVRLRNYAASQPETGNVTALVRPNPMSILVKGLDENLGRAFNIGHGGTIEASSKQEAVNMVFGFCSAPDMLFVVRIVCSLAALLFAFDMISGEKESRKLSLVFSNSVRRTDYIAGKWLGGFFSFIVPFTVLYLAGCVVLALLPDVPVGGGELLRLTSFYAGSFLYLAFFFTLGMMISSLTKSSASSLIIALFAWALIVFIIPGLAVSLSRQHADIPSSAQMEMLRRHIWVKGKYYAYTVPDEEKVSGLGAYLNEEDNKLAADFRGKYNRLVGITQALSRISPSAAFTYFATGIAGTGLDDERRLKDMLVEYRNTVWKLKTSHGGDIPGFDFRPPPLSLCIHRTLIDILIIALYLLLAFTVSFTAFTVYDVR